jgi:hypothetical protein
MTTWYCAYTWFNRVFDQKLYWDLRLTSKFRINLQSRRRQVWAIRSDLITSCPRVNHGAWSNIRSYVTPILYHGIAYPQLSLIVQN